jgi:hypothetical protein
MISAPMNVTAEQRSYARLAGILFLVKLVAEMGGDLPTIILRGGETFAQRSQYVVANEQLWNTALLLVGIAWIIAAVLSFALYTVLEPVDKRQAQLGLLLRVGASFVGGASLMFRVALTRVQTATTSTLFTTEQLAQLGSMLQRGSNAGVYMAWMFMGAGSVLFYLLFLRSRYLPRALAMYAIFTSALLAAVAAASWALPQYQGVLKPLLLSALIADIAVATSLLARGIEPRKAG